MEINPIKTNVTDRYVSHDDRWGTETAEFKCFDDAVEKAIELWGLTRADAVVMCKETMEFLDGYSGR